MFLLISNHRIVRLCVDKRSGKKIVPHALIQVSYRTICAIKASFSWPRGGGSQPNLKVGVALELLDTTEVEKRRQESSCTTAFNHSPPL